MCQRVKRNRLISHNLVSGQTLKEYTQAQLILQSERKPTAFHCLHGEFPFTIFMYSIYPDERFGEFDLTTNVAGQSIAIRFDQIGAIFVNDGGLQLAIGTKGPFGLDGKTLHPVQFSEVAARVHYKAALRDASHTYISAETPDRLTITQTQVCPYTPILLEDGAQRIFRPWDDTESVRFIKRYQQVDWEPVYDELTGMCTTTLMDDAGKLPSPSAVAGTTPRKPKA